MADDLSTMIDGVTSEPPGDDDAAAAIVSPELLEQVRASGRGRQPPRATRAPEGEEAPEEYSTPRVGSRPSDYRRYRKDELVDEVERLAQELRDEKALRIEESKMRREAGDPDAIRELSETIGLATSFAFGVMAQIRGPHWDATPEQSQRIGDTGAKALAPYAANWDWLPIAQFVIALGGTIAQKVVEDKRISALKVHPADTGPDAVG